MFPSSRYWLADGAGSAGVLPTNGASVGEEPLYVRAIYGYDGSSTGSLSFRKGDIIEVRELTGVRHAG